MRLVAIQLAHVPAAEEPLELEVPVEQVDDIVGGALDHDHVPPLLHRVLAPVQLPGGQGIEGGAADEKVDVGDVDELGGHDERGHRRWPVGEAVTEAHEGLRADEAQGQARLHVGHLREARRGGILGQPPPAPEAALGTEAASQLVGLHVARADARAVRFRHRAVRVPRVEPEVLFQLEFLVEGLQSGTEVVPAVRSVLALDVAHRQCRLHARDRRADEQRLRGSHGRRPVELCRHRGEMSFASVPK
mmetsp:Transcript_61119/g.177202  ORF Transcript_61119/g.177202 Transcript_61119/m.177202 type:complete len:247 (+) Transcript_61119:816-1556(+)